MYWLTLRVSSVFGVSSFVDRGGMSAPGGRLESRFRRITEDGDMTSARIAVTVASALFIGFLLTAARPSSDIIPKALVFNASLRGKLLVASPQMKGNIFERSVIVMVKHNEKGAFGLIVNKPISRVGKAKVYKRLGLPNEHVEGQFTIFVGGPVEPKVGFIIHDGLQKFDGTQSVAKDLIVSPERPVIEAMARGEGPARYVVVVGYSGWAPGQLESELQRQDWVTAPLDRDIIFDWQFATKWKRAMETRFQTL